MNILVTHGYLLSGTGSNIYVQNLVRTFVEQGHNVCLLCQDPDAGQLDFVQDVCIFAEDNRSFDIAERKTTTCSGRCNVFIPNIGDLLPVYALDPYPGFDVKIFPDCTDEEIEAYIDFNQQAIETLLDHFQIDVIQTNHIIMFPYIVQQIAKTIRPPYYIKVHGSALNLSVKVQKRLVPYAISGLSSATKLFVNSEYAHSELVDFLEQENNPQLTDRIRIVPAGSNVEQFIFMMTRELPLPNARILSTVYVSNQEEDHL